MNLSILETAAVLSSFFVSVWLIFTADYWLDARKAKQKAKAEWRALSFASKTKRVGNKIAKTKTVKKTGKAIAAGAKKVGDVVSVPVAGAVGAANKMANATEKVIGAAGDVANKAGEVAADAAKAASKGKTVKKVFGTIKGAGSKVAGFFKLEKLEEEPEKKEDDDG